jgi:hypothetical protein
MSVTTSPVLRAVNVSFSLNYAVPPVIPNPPTSPPQSITVSVSGLKPLTPLKLIINGTAVGTFTTDSTGSIDAQDWVPANALLYAYLEMLYAASFNFLIDNGTGVIATCGATDASTARVATVELSY